MAPLAILLLAASLTIFKESAYRAHLGPVHTRVRRDVDATDLAQILAGRHGYQDVLILD